MTGRGSIGSATPGSHRTSKSAVTLAGFSDVSFVAEEEPNYDERREHRVAQRSGMRLRRFRRDHAKEASHQEHPADDCNNGRPSPCPAIVRTNQGKAGDKQDCSVQINDRRNLAFEYVNVER